MGEKKKKKSSPTFPKIIWKKKSVKKKKKKSPPDFIGKIVPVGGPQETIFYLRVASVSNQLFRATG